MAVREMHKDTWADSPMPKCKSGDVQRDCNGGNKMKPTAEDLDRIADQMRSEDGPFDPDCNDVAAVRAGARAMRELERMRPVVDAAIEWDGLGVNAHEDLAAEVCETLADAVKKYQESNNE